MVCKLLSKYTTFNLPSLLASCLANHSFTIKDTDLFKWTRMLRCLFCVCWLSRTMRAQKIAPGQQVCPIKECCNSRSGWKWGVKDLFLSSYLSYSWHGTKNSDHTVGRPQGQHTNITTVNTNSTAVPVASCLVNYALSNLSPFFLFLLPV